MRLSKDGERLGALGIEDLVIICFFWFWFCLMFSFNAYAVNVIHDWTLDDYEWDL